MNWICKGIFHKFFNTNKYWPKTAIQGYTRLLVARQFYNGRMVYALIMLCRLPRRLEFMPLDNFEFSLIKRCVACSAHHREHVEHNENVLWLCVCVFFFLFLFRSNAMRLFGWNIFRVTRTKLPVAISIVANHDVHENIVCYSKINKFVFGERTAEKKMIIFCCEQCSRHLCQQNIVKAHMRGAMSTNLEYSWWAKSDVRSPASIHPFMALE